MTPQEHRSALAALLRIQLEIARQAAYHVPQAGLPPIVSEELGRAAELTSLALERMKEWR